MMSQFVDLKNRLVLSSLLTSVLAVLIYFSMNKFVQLTVVLLISTIAIVAIWEYLLMLKTKNIELPFWLLATLAVVLVFSSYLTILKISVSSLSTLVIGISFFAIFFYYFRQIEGALVKIPTCLFTALYLVVPLALMLRILYPSSIPSHFEDGRIWFTYLIVVTKITDAGAYFAGKLWGKGKLAPHLSPKKTLTGAFAGFLTAMIASFVFFLIAKICPLSMFQLSFDHALLLGALIGIFGQLGDLAESLLKRDANVKDSNKIPGIGGVLDTLDSLLFTSPILFFFLRTMAA